MPTRDWTETLTDGGCRSGGWSIWGMQVAQSSRGLRAYGWSGALGKAAQLWRGAGVRRRQVGANSASTAAVRYMRWSRKTGQVVKV